ncbi:hypothetical protein E5676_scaffold836G00110 [Cucumis melo var. makuwa]|uniref:Uncharacterized protein n=1 Tax=Cucumis melo var. makuwa TaxID=1194695 RepID=A0A5D3DEU4_CUCMM|nr:hypothetical protein E5676_scaffold836G00110 [Cucumis melo var. makuwa]
MKGGPIGSTYQSSDPVGSTYQSSAPEGYTTWGDPVGHRAGRVLYPICSRDLTLKFLGPTASSFGNSSLYLGNVTASCSLCDIRCKELFTDRHRCPDVLYIVVMLMGYVVDWNCMSMDFKVLRLDGLVWTEGLICASFGITRLICVSLGITRLIGVSFGIPRLICASFGITGLMCKGTARGRPTRGRKNA